MTYLDKLENVASIIPTATHAQLDELADDRMLFIPGWKAGRAKIADRRFGMLHLITRKIQNDHKQALLRQKRDAFIGPLTTTQRNGHPF